MLPCIGVHILTKSALRCTCRKHKPVGSVAESPSRLLSASADSEEDGEAVTPFASNDNERERDFITWLHVSLKRMPLDKRNWHNGLNGESLNCSCGIVSPLTQKIKNNS